MKTIKKFTLITIGTITFIVIALLVGFEFYVWRLHDYNPDYATRQKCIETGDDKACEDHPSKISYVLHAHFDKDDPNVQSQIVTCEAYKECTFPLRYKDQRIIIKSVLSPDLKITLQFYKDNQQLWTGNSGHNVYEIDGVSKKSESHKIPLALPNPAYLKDAGRDEAVMRYAGPDVATVNIWVEAGK